jgi:RNA polymerase sigma factor (sigma-70 family)
MTHSTQRALVDAAKHGDQDAFATIATDAADRLYAVAFRILRDPELARDAAQQALLNAWRDLRTLRDPDRLDPWLYRLVVRACYAEARQRRRTIGLANLAVIRSVHEQPIAQVDDHDQLERGFRRLSPEQRTVVVLHFYLDLPLTEVAGIMGIPEGTVRSRLHYAISGLRAALEADGRSVSGMASGKPDQAKKDSA